MAKDLTHLPFSSAASARRLYCRHNCTEIQHTVRSLSELFQAIYQERPFASMHVSFKAFTTTGLFLKLPPQLMLSHQGKKSSAAASGTDALCVMGGGGC